MTIEIQGQQKEIGTDAKSGPAMPAEVAAFGSIRFGKDMRVLPFVQK
jgi:hypothetical protein